MTRWIQRVVLLSLAVAGLVALLVWWWLRRCRLEEEVILTTELGTVSRVRGVGRPAPSAPSEPAPSPEAQAQVSQIKEPPLSDRDATPGELQAIPSDDLKRIAGIGPKISSVLQAAGIASYAQLADADGDNLRQILSQAGIRLADPATWPEQARLAAARDWQGLKDLQSQLKGGRRA
ncbi:MAG: hypothetical protein Kow0063_01540 [Anaerolineae bacterium]